MQPESEIEARRARYSIDPLIPYNFPYNPDELRSNCEGIVGYIPVPMGVAGPISVDSQEYLVPLATTEGALVASINRGCKLLRQCGGVSTVQTDDGMTRGPVIQFPNTKGAFGFAEWINSDEGFGSLRRAFDETSRYARLVEARTKQVGRLVYIRLKATTGEAMGMNMLGKGTEAAVRKALTQFPSGDLLSLTGNFCTDKKASALNWIEGRGKSVIAEAVIDANLISGVLHVRPERLLAVHQSKCMIGSAISGSLGGSNAHAANVIAAVFLATGQDIAQVVDSSFCMTLLEAMPDGTIHASVTLPCIQIGCVGGGTRLAPQQAALRMLRGESGDAAVASRVLAAAVLAGELSLLGSLAEGSLMQTHLRLNRH